MARNGRGRGRTTWAARYSTTANPAAVDLDPTGKLTSEAPLGPVGPVGPENPLDWNQTGPTGVT